MGNTDRLTTESHLDQAIRHLGTAEVVARNLDATGELSRTDRHELSDVVAAARERLDAIAEALAGRGFAHEFAALVAEPWQTTTPTTDPIGGGGREGL